MLRTAVFLFLLKEYYCYLVLPASNGTLRFPLRNGSFEINPTFSRKAINSSRIPISFDWRDEKKVTPVKNQGGCAACWAFSATANIESHLAIHRNMQEVSLSEQFLIDCDDAKTGCGPGLMTETFANIVAKLGGVLQTTDYDPYQEKRMECRWNASNPRPEPIPVIGFKRVYPDENVMAEYLCNNGPLSAAINAESMKRYKGNYIDEPTAENCNPHSLDHAVLIVGYNVYETPSGRKVPYWIIKNSWGPDWGDNGFYYMVRGRNACGITSDVSFAYVK